MSWMDFKTVQAMKTQKTNESARSTNTGSSKDPKSHTGAGSFQVKTSLSAPKKKSEGLGVAQKGTREKAPIDATSFHAKPVSSAPTQDVQKGIAEKIPTINLSPMRAPSNNLRDSISDSSSSHFNGDDEFFPENNNSSIHFVGGDEPGSFEPKEFKSDDLLSLCYSRLYLIGDSGVGKTSLLNRMLSGETTLPDPPKRTPLVQVKQVRIDNKNAIFEENIFPVVSNPTLPEIPHDPSSTVDSVSSSSNIDIKVEYTEKIDSLILDIFDLGGQHVYQNAYKYLMIENAIFIIVMKLSWDLDTLLSRFTYWQRLISTENTNLGTNDAFPIVVVLTHIDEVTIEERKRKYDDLKKKLEELEKKRLKKLNEKTTNKEGEKQKRANNNESKKNLEELPIKCSLNLFKCSNVSNDSVDDLKQFVFDIAKARLLKLQQVYSAAVIQKMWKIKLNEIYGNDDYILLKKITEEYYTSIENDRIKLDKEVIDAGKELGLFEFVEIKSRISVSERFRFILFRSNKFYSDLALALIDTAYHRMSILKDNGKTKRQLLLAHLNRGTVPKNVVTAMIGACLGKQSLTGNAQIEYFEILSAILQNRGLAVRHYQESSADILILPVLMDEAFPQSDLTKKKLWESKDDSLLSPGQSSQIVCHLIDIFLHDMEFRRYMQRLEHSTCEKPHIQTKNQIDKDIISELKGFRHGVVVKLECKSTFYTYGFAIIQSIAEHKDLKTPFNYRHNQKHYSSFVIYGNDYSGSVVLKQILEYLEQTYEALKNTATKSDMWSRSDNWFFARILNIMDQISGFSESCLVRKKPLKTTGNPWIELKNENFSELHTHLMGMGSCEFWVNRVMCEYVFHSFPWFEKDRLQWNWNNLISALREIGNRDFKLKTKLNTIKEENVSGNTIKEVIGLLHPCKTEITPEDLLLLYTNDIVYSYDILCKALLGVDPTSIDLACRVPAEDRLSCLEKILSNPNTKSVFSRVFRTYIIFNCREQKFQVLYGLPNSYLVYAMELEKEHAERSSFGLAVEAAIRNCFSMLNKDGSTPKMADLNNYRGCFSPKFYPMRFALKDSLYEQDPRILSMLLNNCLHRYSKAGVKYVEFSIGINDAMKSYMWQYLTEDAVWGKERSVPEWAKCTTSYMPNPGNIIYRFLAAFPRSVAFFPKAKGTETKTIFDSWVENLDGYVMHNANIKKRRSFVAGAWPRYSLLSEKERDKMLYLMFKFFIQKSDQIMEFLKTDDGFRKTMIKYVVGFDLGGEEDGFPFSPFLHSNFQKVIKKWKEYNPFFGIRFHGGEGVKRGSSCSELEEQMHAELEYEPPNLRNFAAHMNIIFFELQQLWKITKYERPNKFLPCLRIGHGVAFSYHAILSVPPTEKDGSPNLSREITTDFPAMRRWLKQTKIPLELNMTSNSMLLNDVFVTTDRPMDTTVLKYFVECGMIVVLSTDDDGIWPIHKCKEHYEHISVMNEFCKAITSHTITFDEAKEMMKHSWEHRFCNE